MFKFTRKRKRHVSSWKRRSFTANPADPTAVTTWKFKSRYLTIDLISSWGTEMNLRFPEHHFKFFTIPGFGIRRYDTFTANYVFSLLERRHEKEQAKFDEFDPYHESFWRG